MPAFPLGNCPIYASYNRGAPTRAVVRTQMEVGPPKRRLRSSMGLYPIVASYAVTRNQLATFEAWFHDDIGMGALTFDWDDPRTGTSRAVHFADGGYGVAQISPKLWRLDVQLEEWI